MAEPHPHNNGLTDEQIELIHPGMKQGILNLDVRLIPLQALLDVFSQFEKVLRKAPETLTPTEKELITLSINHWRTLILDKANTPTVSAEQIN